MSARNVKYCQLRADVSTINVLLIADIILISKIFQKIVYKFSINFYKSYPRKNEFEHQKDQKRLTVL